MKAVRIHKHGGPEVVQVDELPRPEPGPKEVAVNIKAAALNHLDLWVRNSLPNVNFPLPLIMGSDGAGVITAVGSEVDGWMPGDEVVIQPGVFCGTCPICLNGTQNLCQSYGILGESQDGVQAQQIVVGRDNVFPKPSHLAFEEAASYGLVFLTAYQMLVKRAGILAGEVVLILGGNSGVGAAAIQIANAMGAKVIATASAGPKSEFALSMGAHAVVDHYHENWYKEVLELAGPEKVGVVIEHVGEATWQQSMRTMGTGARMVTCGATTGSKVGFDLRHLYRKHQSIMGSTMGDLDSFARVTEGFAKGIYRPFVDRVFGLDEIQEAHKHLEQSKQMGKVVINLD
ncbi:zinc-binding dehydrogenase [Candidatus Neomarinimicrobiota bacterium]